MDSIRAELQKFRTPPPTGGSITATLGERVAPCASTGLCPFSGANAPTEVPESVTSDASDYHAKLPQLVEALERILTLADQLGSAASVREAAARNARMDGRYDQSEAYRAAATRMRATQQSLMQEITAAFQSL